MRTFAITLTITLAFIAQTNATRVSIPEAVKKGLISVTASYKHPGNYFYGQCLNITIKSKSTAKVDLVLEAGRFLQPNDSSQQIMMVTEELLTSVQPNKSITIEAFGMCSQMHKSAPSDGIAMTVSNKADGHLLALAQLISANKYRSGAAQNAIWVLTDNNDLESIYCDDEKEMNTLLDFCIKVTGKTITKPFAKPKKNTATGQLHGKISFDNLEKCKLSMFLYNGNNEKVITFFENQELEKTNHFSIDYEINYRKIEGGIFYLRVFKNSATLLYNKAIKIE